MVVGVEGVFGEIGGEENDLVAWVEDGVQDDVDGAAGANGHDDLVGGEGEAGFVGEGVGDSGASLVVAGVGHIAVAAVGGAGEEALEGLVELRGGLHDGIAEGEVEDVAVAEALFQSGALLEHASYPGGLFHGAAHSMGNGHWCSQCFFGWSGGVGFDSRLKRRSHRTPNGRPLLRPKLRLEGSRLTVTLQERLA